MEQKHRSVLVQSFEEGVRKVENGNYAFLTETPLLEYAIRNNCNFTQVGGLLSNTRAYAVATPKDSIWRKPISEAIRSLHADGFLQRLHEKWLLSTNDLSNNNSTNDSQDTYDMDNVNVRNDMEIGQMKHANITVIPTTTATTTATTSQTYINNNFILKKSAFLASFSDETAHKPPNSKNRNSVICNQDYNRIGDKYQGHVSYNFYNEKDTDTMNYRKQPVNALHLENVGTYSKSIILHLLCITCIDNMTVRLDEITILSFRFRCL